MLGNITLGDVSTSDRGVLDSMRVAGTIGSSATPVTIKVGLTIGPLMPGGETASLDDDSARGPLSYDFGARKRHILAGFLTAAAESGVTPSLSPDEAAVELGYDGAQGFLDFAASLNSDEQLDSILELVATMIGG